MLNKHPVQDLVEPIIDGLGFEVVRIMTIGTKNPTLQIMIERKDRKDLIVERLCNGQPCHFRGFG